MEVCENARSPEELWGLLRTLTIEDARIYVNRLSPEQIHELAAFLEDRGLTKKGYESRN